MAHTPPWADFAFATEMSQG